MVSIEPDAENEGQRNSGSLHFEKGRIYFSRDLERKFYFLLAVFLLLAGLMQKLGVLG